MSLLPFPKDRAHERLAALLEEEEPTARLVQQPTPWRRKTWNEGWAKPNAVNAWTSRLLSAYVMDPEAMMEVEVRLARDGIPEEGVGELSGRGLLWLLAHRQDDRFSPSAELWEAVQNALKTPADARAALAAAEGLLTPSNADPWGLRPTLYTDVMAGWRKGALGTAPNLEVVGEFLSSRIVLWRNFSVPGQIIASVQTMASPDERLKSLSRMFSCAEADFMDTYSDQEKKNIRDAFATVVQQGARLTANDPWTEGWLTTHAPEVLAQLRKQSLASVGGSPPLEPHRIRVRQRG